jgi:serine/threonine protein kinase
METDPRVSELLLRWQELRQEGQTVTAADLCAGCPELAEELKRRMETVDYWEGFLGAEEEEEAAAPVPASFGKFQVVRALGGGGQGSTLLALDPDLRCHVVLKLYHRARTPEEQERVLREGQALARVRSPYVAQCRGVERQGGVPALVVEYVPGRDLKAQQKARPLGTAEALELTRQLAEGLAAVHACGLLHRDLKPGNVLVGDDGRPRLVDFGLAVPVASAELAGVSGTLAYMAPEQARGEAERIDPRTDVFGLGAILYELLAGRPPHQGETREGLLRAACAGDVVPPRQVNPRVPRAVNDLCLRSLAKDPAQRFASAAEMAWAVRRFQRWRRLRWPLAAAALLLATLVAALPVVSRLWPRTATQSPVGAAALKGSIDVVVTEPGNARRQLLHLHDPPARPLKKGDEVRVVAELNRPAYLYVLWIDTRGKVLPVYPWLEGEWGRRPDQERPVQRLGLPEKPGDVWPILPGPAGMEALVLLARETPLQREVDLAKALGDRGPQPLLDEMDVAWFENGELVRDEPERGPNLKEPGEGSNPVLRTQGLLRERLKDLGFTYTRAITFANRGGP